MSGLLRNKVLLSNNPQTQTKEPLVTDVGKEISALGASFSCIRFSPLAFSL